MALPQSLKYQTYHICLAIWITIYEILKVFQHNILKEIHESIKESKGTLKEIKTQVEPQGDERKR